MMFISNHAIERLQERFAHDSDLERYGFDPCDVVRRSAMIPNKETFAVINHRLVLVCKRLKRSVLILTVYRATARRLKTIAKQFPHGRLIDLTSL